MYRREPPDTETLGHPPEPGVSTYVFTLHTLGAIERHNDKTAQGAASVKVEAAP